MDKIEKNLKLIGALYNFDSESFPSWISDTDDDCELSEEILDNLSAAGTACDRLLKKLYSDDDTGGKFK